MKRWDLLNDLIRRRGYTRYLEIGTYDWANLARVSAPIRVGVEPAAVAPAPSGVLHVPVESDAFFAMHTALRFDLVFIDGLHHADQVHRDVMNSLAALTPGGTIVLHDCNPPEESWQLVPRPDPERPWCGDCWRVIPRLRESRPDLDVAVLDSDRGLGIVRPNAGRASAWSRPYRGRPAASLSWPDLERERSGILNLVGRDNADWLL